MPVDNELYNRLSDTWWDENTVLGSMRTGLNPGRFGYFKQVLLEKLRMDLQGKKVFDVGSNMSFSRLSVTLSVPACFLSSFSGSVHLDVLWLFTRKRQI